MSTSAIFLSAATGSSTALFSASREKARAACAEFVKGYQHDKATVNEMREYAGCIERLHPAPMTDADLYAAKFAVVVIFVAMLIGIVYERKHRIISDTWPGAVFTGSLMGGLFGLVALVLGYSVVLGISVLIA